jgi:hypothetical protein
MSEIKHHLPFGEYQKLAAVHKSDLWTLLVASPAHYRYQIEHPKPPTAEMLLGSAFHTYLLERPRFETEYVVSDGPINPKTGFPFGRETKAMGEWIAQQAKPVVCGTDFQRLRAMAERVLYNEQARVILEAGEAEVSLTWDMAGKTCKGRMDWLAEGGNLFCDVKTTRSANPKSFARDAANMGYFMQMAFYADGYERITGKRAVPVIIAIEKEEPYACAVYVIGEAGLTLGRDQYQEALRRLAEAEKAGTWDAYPGELELVPPKWAGVDMTNVA